jgi:large subunit ribosomal protein L29
MEASELRNFSVEELKGRIRQWREELFHSKFKSQSAETKDTSVLRKLRKDIARGLTVLNEKAAGVEVAAKPAKAVTAKKAEVTETVEAAPSDKPAAAKKTSTGTKAKKPKAAKSGEEK